MQPAGTKLNFYLIGLIMIAIFSVKALTTLPIPYNI